MEPRAFLELARELSGKKDDEAAWRSAISRGYYALFNAMAIFVHENIERLAGAAEDHQRVYRYFHNCGDDDFMDIASSLSDLREDRNECDYKLASRRFADMNTVRLVFKKAEIAFEGFQRMAGRTANKKRVIKGIRDYKLRVEGGHR
jgi:hypothetical protein